MKTAIGLLIGLYLLGFFLAIVCQWAMAYSAGQDLRGDAKLMFRNAALWPWSLFLFFRR